MALNACELEIDLFCHGMVVPPDTPGTITEAFISGTQPGANSFSR